MVLVQVFHGRFFFLLGCHILNPSDPPVMCVYMSADDAIPSTGNEENQQEAVSKFQNGAQKWFRVEGFDVSIRE
jgi:hypothetical protein